MIEFPLFLAVFMQVLLTYYLGVKLFLARKNAINNKEVTFADIAVDSTKWPANVRQIQNSLANQFEMPVLFYVAAIMAFQTGVTDWVFITLSYIFVVSRWIHMFIHTGDNHVMRRAKAYGVGILVLLIMWLYLAFLLFSRAHL